MSHYWSKNARKKHPEALKEMKQSFAASGLMDWHVNLPVDQIVKNQENSDYYQQKEQIRTVQNHDLCDTKTEPNAQHMQTHNIYDQDDTDHQSDTMVAPPEFKRPPKYAVVLLNDDYTPMEFVIEILQQYFALDLDRATQVMLSVHYEGKGIAGVYPRDIAETKANQVNNYARSQGHPLLCQIEPQE